MAFKLLILLLLGESVFAMTRLSNSVNIDGCYECALNGNCDHAYLNASGQLCTTLRYTQEDALLLYKPCCCPVGAICMISKANKCYCGGVSDIPIVKMSIVFGVSVILLVICIYVINSVNVSNHTYSKRGAPIYIEPQLDTERLNYGSCDTV
jgi:hypothetical protein